jgi:hypothetical protein
VITPWAGVPAWEEITVQAQLIGYHPSNPANWLEDMAVLPVPCLFEALGAA